MTLQHDHFASCNTACSEQPREMSELDKVSGGICRTLKFFSFRADWLLAAGQTKVSSLKGSATALSISLRVMRTTGRAVPGCNDFSGGVGMVGLFLRSSRADLNSDLHHAGD
jgi:hypothetical protein